MQFKNFLLKNKFAVGVFGTVNKTVYAERID